MMMEAQRYEVPPSSGQSPADQGLPPDHVRPYPGYDNKTYDFKRVYDPLSREWRWVPRGGIRGLPRPPRGGTDAPGGLGSWEGGGVQSNPGLPYHPIYNPGGYRPTVIPSQLLSDELLIPVSVTHSPTTRFWFAIWFLFKLSVDIRFMIIS